MLLVGVLAITASRFGRSVCTEMIKYSRLKFSRTAGDLQKPQALNPTNIKAHTVLSIVSSHMTCCFIA